MIQLSIGKKKILIYTRNSKKGITNLIKNNRPPLRAVFLYPFEGGEESGDNKPIQSDSHGS